MHLSIFKKIFLVIFSFTALSLLALGMIIAIYGVQYQQRVEQMNDEVVAYAEAETAHVVLSLAKTEICAIAENVAMRAEEEIEKQQSTLRALLADVQFASSTARVIFAHGATGILEPRGKFVVSHPLASYVGKELSSLPEYTNPSLAPLWNILDESVILDRVSGSYMKPYSQTDSRTRVICLVRVPLLTADNVRLVSFAVADRDDFGITDDMLDVSLRQKYGAASALAINARNDLKELFTLAFFVLLCIAFLLSWSLSSSISRSLNTLLNVCEHIGYGRLDASVPIRGTGDEVDQLAVSIARMQHELRTQKEIIERQSKSAELLGRELNDVLRTVEERTKQLLADEQDGSR